MKHVLSFLALSLFANDSSAAHPSDAPLPQTTARAAGMLTVTDGYGSDAAPDTIEMAAETTDHDKSDHLYPEARPYDAAIDASAALDAAFLQAAANGKLVMAIFGANWCHDSRALAGWLETPRFRKLTDAEFEIVYINVGMPQTQDGHNLDIAARMGVAVAGTPTVAILTPQEELLNADSATSWRNAASRNADAIYEEFAGFADAGAGTSTGGGTDAAPGQ